MVLCLSCDLKMNEKFLIDYCLMVLREETLKIALGLYKEKNFYKQFFRLYLEHRENLVENSNFMNYLKS